MHRRFGPGHKDKQLAAALNVDRSTINRIRNSQSAPAGDKLEKLSRYFNVSSATWDKAPDVFAKELDKQEELVASETRSCQSVLMRAIGANQHLWHDSFNVHRGQYIAYWCAHGIEQTYVGSLVEIISLDAAGMRFNMVNPYIREDVDNDNIRHWRYEGVVYPVADYLYFYGEQIGSTYELFTMIMTASPVAPPDLLRGCLCGIYVKDGQRQIAVNVAIVLVHVPKPISDWKMEVGHRLGKIPAYKLHERIKRILDSYPGVIPV